MIKSLAKIDRASLPLIDFKIVHTWMARFFAIYLTHEWFLFATRSDAYNRYTFRIMVTMVPKVFCLYVIGLWLSTTQWGVRHKKTMYFLLLPSFFMSPSIAGFPFNIMGWLSFFVAIWSYIVIYGTKKEKIK